MVIECVSLGTKAKGLIPKGEVKTLPDLSSDTGSNDMSNRTNIEKEIEMRLINFRLAMSRLRKKAVSPATRLARVFRESWKN